MKKVSEKYLYKGEWVNVKELNYLSKEGNKVRWEVLERNNDRTAVIIIAKLLPSNRYLLIKQFRPALDNYVIGFPAGLTTKKNIKKEALRELKEETGYTGRIIDTGPAMKSGTGSSNTNTIVVSAVIDENAVKNRNPEQNLEPEEEIEVIKIAENKIRNYLLKEKKKGTDIGVGPWYVFGLLLP